MAKTLKEFQIFAKPASNRCNLNCSYCYYTRNVHLQSIMTIKTMSDDVLRTYISQQIKATSSKTVYFSWHGGEPTILGLEYFHRIISLQQELCPRNKHIINCIQTNATLLNDEWCNFFASYGFFVGISLDGPTHFHDQFRVTKEGLQSHAHAIRGYELLRKHRIATEILCVVNSHTVNHPLEVYRFFKELEAQHITFLPLVEYCQDSKDSVSEGSVPAHAFGDFLCALFDEWIAEDIGTIKVQLFEEALRTAFNQEHTLCIFKKTCGRVLVIEPNGDVYSCDHFVDSHHMLGNIMETPFVEMLESRTQRKFGQIKFETLPHYCKACEVRDMCNGECPKNRFCKTNDGETGLNYLCPGYKQFFTYCKPFVKQVASLWRSL